MTTVYRVSILIVLTTSWCSTNLLAEIVPPGAPGTWGDHCLKVEQTEQAFQRNDADFVYQLAQAHYPELTQDFENDLITCVETDVGRAMELLDEAEEMAVDLIERKRRYPNFWLGYGRIYADGAANVRDSDRALEYYRRAIGSPPYDEFAGPYSAFLQIAELLNRKASTDEDYREVKSWYERAMEQKVASVQATGEELAGLARLYEQGLGVDKDDEKALRLTTMALEHDNKTALYQMAMRHIEGRGVPQDLNVGFEMLNEAARYGVNDALFELAVRHRKGDGVTQDLGLSKQMTTRALWSYIKKSDSTNVLKMLEFVNNPNDTFFTSYFVPKSQLSSGELFHRGERAPILSVAAANGLVEAVEYLLAQGAYPNALSETTATSPMWFAAKGGSTKIINLLHSAGAKLNEESLAAGTGRPMAPIDVARFYRNHEAAEVLQQIGGVSAAIAHSDTNAFVERNHLSLTEEFSEKIVLKARNIQTPAPDMSMAEFARTEKPTSQWYQSRKSRYRTMLLTQDYDLLVVPVQIQRFGIDVEGRALMTHVLTDSLRQASDLRIPDATLVMKAMGDPWRRFDDQEIFDLARSLGVSQVVRTFVGHDRANDLRVTVLHQKATDNLLSERTKVIRMDSDVLKFTDEELPSDAFASIVRYVVANVTPESTQDMSISASKDAVLSFPERPGDLVSDNTESVLQTIEDLELFAAFSPHREPRYRERLYTRALALLNRLPGHTRNYALLRARALYYLHRRPAALAALSHGKYAPGAGLC